MDQHDGFQCLGSSPTGSRQGIYLISTRIAHHCIERCTGIQGVAVSQILLSLAYDHQCRAKEKAVTRAYDGAKSYPIGDISWRVGMTAT